MAQVTELVTKFGFEGSIQPMDNFNTSMGQSIKLLAGVTAAVGAASAAFLKFAKSQYEAVDPMVQLQRTTDVSMERMQELGFIASVSGSSLDAVTGTMDALSQKIGEASIKGSEDFARLGISVRDASGQVKTADVVFDELQQRFKTMNLSLQQKQSIAQSLGVDKTLIQLLNRSGEEMDELTKKARQFGIVTKEQGNQLADVNDAFTMAEFGMQGLQRQIALGVAPELKGMADGFADLILENGEFVKAIASGAIKIIKSLMESINRLLPLLALGAAAFLAIKIQAMGFATVMSTIFSPVVLVTGAIIAALAIIDDLIVAFKGGQSVIADFAQEFLGLDIRPMLQGSVDIFMEFIEVIKTFYDTMFGFISETAGSIVDVAGSMMDAVGSAADFLGFGGGGEAINTTASSNVTNAPTSNRIQQSNQITINASNASEAQAGVEAALQNQLRDAHDFVTIGGR